MQAREATNVDDRVADGASFDSLKVQGDVPLEKTECIGNQAVL